MSSFVSGLAAARHDALGEALQRAFAAVPGFAATDVRGAGVVQPVSFAAQGVRAASPASEPDGPRHFAPADAAANPTEGWNMFEPDAEAASPSVFVDPVEVARSAGYDAGYADALAEARAAASRDQALLGALGEALQGGRLDREAVAARLRQTVLYLVTQLVGEIGIAPERLAARIAAAADMLSDQAEAAMLRVHPQDVALLDGKLPPTIFAVGDAAVARGSFVLESASTIVEDGPELWLEQLGHAIERVAMPAGHA
jgi:flagellar assembly protein FliH